MDPRQFAPPSTTAQAVKTEGPKGRRAAGGGGEKSNDTKVIPGMIHNANKSGTSTRKREQLLLHTTGHTMA